MPRARPPEPTLHETLSDQFSTRDQASIKLYRHITTLLSLTQSQGRRIAKLEANLRQLEKRLRDLEPREPAIEPVRRGRVDMVFSEDGR
jgi:hypothetical protein